MTYIAYKHGLLANVYIANVITTLGKGKVNFQVQD